VPWQTPHQVNMFRYSSMFFMKVQAD